MSSSVDKYFEDEEKYDERMKHIGQNGNDGLHYKKNPQPGDQLEFNFEEDE
jgi:hypothetical protein